MCKETGKVTVRKMSLIDLMTSGKLLIIAILFLVFISQASLFGAPDDIELPDIVIVGQTEKLPDTISLDSLLQRYWSLNDLTVFTYRPFISFAPVKPYPIPSPPENTGALAVNTGSDFNDYYFADIKGIFCLPENSLHRYSLTFLNETYLEERQTTHGSFLWFPTLSDIDGGQILYTDISLNLFADETPFSNEIQHFGFGLDFHSPQELLIFTDTYLSLRFNSFSQDREFKDKESLNDLDFSLFTMIPLNNEAGKLAHIPVSLSSVRKKEAFSAGFILDNFSLFEKLGVYIMADDNTVLPSAVFKLNYHFNPSLSVHLDNSPSYESESRIDYIIDNPDQVISFENPLTKTILNSTFSLHSSYYLPVTLSYNILHHKDYHYYGLSPDSTSFEIKDTDILKHNARIAVAYSFGNYTLNIGSGYCFTDTDSIPFLPEWNHSLQASWKSRNTGITAEMSFLTGIKGVDGNVRDDAILLDLALRQMLTDNLTLNFDLGNILGSDYTKYQFPSGGNKTVPHKELTVQAGLTWSF